MANTNQDNKFVFVTTRSQSIEHLNSPQYSYWKSVFRRFFSSKVAIIMLVISTLVVLMSFIHPIFSGYDHALATDINDFSNHFLPPSSVHWFGTDQIGRDFFDGIWAGTRVSLSISFVATIISVSLGIIVGAFWGYSKKMDVIMLEVYNIFSNIPFTLVVLVILYILGPGIKQMIFALCCTSWLGTAYFIRIQVMIIRDREYNLASRCLGTSIPNIIIHNVLPFMVSVVVTSLSRAVPSFISMEVFLSYIGVGLNKNVPSLGQMIQDNSVHMHSVPHLFWIPVFVSSLISVSLYMVGQTLADASDPKTHMQ